MENWGQVRAECGRLLVYVAAMACTCWAASQSVQDIARSGLASTVTLTVFNDDGVMFRSGSGFVVAPGLVMTNFHVVEGAHYISGHRVGEINALWVESVVRLDARLDLALLAFEGNVGPALQLNSSRPDVGATVFAVGSPLGLEGTFTQGIVSSYRQRSGISLMQISAPISHGSSGGPVLDGSGRVIGIVVATIEDGQNLNFAIPADVAQIFLEQSNSGTHPYSMPAPSARDDQPGPSFDCELARSWSELTICNSKQLAELDVMLSDAYDVVRTRLDNAAFELVRLEQRTWLKDREACEAQPPYWRESCLAGFIRDRITALEGY